jgi:cellulose synthase/poly-beta-1,6-N-acetylglucosamine synthase-like glycosyltransferase
VEIIRNSRRPYGSLAGIVAPRGPSTRGPRQARGGHAARRNKSPGLYLVVIGMWAALMAELYRSTSSMVASALSRNVVIGVLVIMTVVFIGYFWMNGIKDIVYTVFYHVWLKHHVILPPARHLDVEPLVVLVYCTCNDFNGQSLLASMRQDYRRFTTVILDDSTKSEYLLAIDKFAGEHGIEVIRRKDNSGFKAGNLNNYLKEAKYDYFVILDSDEIIPQKFIRRGLDYFAASQKTGIVQANHWATRNRTPFMKMFARGVDSHWPTYQLVKDRYGFLSLLGHGAMVSRRCYQAAGGFPHVVAEDICFSIAARRAGFMTAFAPDILCEEEYPVDFTAFKRRHGKWTEGNMEFIRKNTWKILIGKMTWYEKLDIVLFTYSLPLTALFSLYVVINAIIFPAIGYTFRYPLWMLAPTFLFLIAPMLNDIVTYWKKMEKGSLLSYLLHSTLLYGSMYFVSLRASFKSALGKSVFHVTPKNSTAVRFREAIRLSAGELVFGIVLAASVIGVAGSILPVILLALPAVFAPYLTVMHHEEDFLYESQRAGLAALIDASRPRFTAEASRTRNRVRRPSGPDRRL